MPLLSRRTLFSSPTSILPISHNLRPKFHHTFPPQNHVFKRRDEDCHDFLPWLEKKAGVRISSLLYIGKSTFGRSLFACKNIKAGDCLLKVPFSVQITPDDLHPEIKPLIADEVGNVAKLAVVILVEQKKAQGSEWTPYITSLPQLEDMHSTLFWSPQELKMIQHSSVYRETVDQQAQIKNDYLALRPVMDRFPKYFKDVSFEDFRHAYGLVASRAWECPKGLSLIPFADFLNHDGTSESSVLIDDDKHISEVCVQVDITSDDKLTAMKLDLLQKHCLPKMKGERSSSSDGSFVIKKVRSSSGKGKGIPQSLRAFARVMSCNSSKELDELAVEASENDGRLARHPLSNWTLEMQAHEFLLSRINYMIDTHNVSIKSLRSSASNKCGKHALRQLMARDLLTAEVQVLESAAGWLENYCHNGKIVDPNELGNTMS